jgi:hypothetical protein
MCGTDKDLVLLRRVVLSLIKAMMGSELQRKTKILTMFPLRKVEAYTNANRFRKVPKFIRKTILVIRGTYW